MSGYADPLGQRPGHNAPIHAGLLCGHKCRRPCINTQHINMWVTCAHTKTTQKIVMHTQIYTCAPISNTLAYVVIFACSHVRHARDDVLRACVHACGVAVRISSPFASHTHTPLSYLFEYILFQSSARVCVPCAAWWIHPSAPCARRSSCALYIRCIYVAYTQTCERMPCVFVLRAVVARKWNETIYILRCVRDQEIDDERSPGTVSRLRYN